MDLNRIKQKKVKTARFQTRIEAAAKTLREAIEQAVLLGLDIDQATAAGYVLTYEEQILRNQLDDMSGLRGE